jgi:hypothetical protein
MLNRFAWQAVPPIQVIVKSDHVTLDSVVANEADKDGWGRSAEKVQLVAGATIDESELSGISSSGVFQRKSIRCSGFAPERCVLMIVCCCHEYDSRSEISDFAQFLLAADRRSLVVACAGTDFLRAVFSKATA